MFIKVLVLDEMLEPVFLSTTSVDAVHLIATAESRESLIKSKGAVWTAGLVSGLGKQLIELMQTGTLGKELDMAATDVAMAAWLHDATFSGVEEDAFVQCELEFTLLSDGAVYYRRRPVH